ncbi:MAG: AAA family ATPase [Thermoplasmata archaeon]|nr:AAA family ATPase [Thermoplasmata archaeon]
MRFVSDLVGRQREVERMESFLGRTVQKDGGVLLITGEAGVGKTRLAQEACRSAEGHGLEVLSVACQDQDRGVAYAPWVALVRGFVARNPKEVVFRTARPYLSALTRLAPELSEKIWLHDPGVPASTDWERRQFLAAVAGFFVDASTARPLLISIDDVGWADVASLELLETVARVSRGKPLGIVGTYRDSHLDDNPALQAMLVSLERERWATTLLVPPLDPEQLGTFLSLVLERREVSPEFRDLVYAKTRGNPFYTTEILQAMADEGLVYRAAGGWDWKPISEITLPATVGGTIGARLRRLDEEGLQILRVASLFGQEFSFDLLQAVVETPQDRVLLALERAERARLIRGRPSRPLGDEFEFAHPLIQEVLEKEVSVVRSRVVHLKAARVLQGRYGAEANAHSATLAFHYLRGNDAPHALEYSVEAGNQSAAAFARAEAAGHFRNALELLPEPPDPNMAAALKERLADQVRGLADVAKAAGLYVEAARLWEGLGNRTSAGSCLLRAADCWLGPVHQGLELLEQSRRLLEGEPPGVTLVRWHLSWGAAIFDQGRVAEADQESRKGLDLARRIGDASGEASALLRLGYTTPLERWRDSVALNEQAGIIIEREHLVDQAGLLLISRAIVSYHLEGNIGEATAIVHSAVGKARQVGDIEWESWWMGFAVPWASVRSGDFRMALDLVEERRRRFKHLSLSRWAPDVEAVGVRAWLSILLGPPEEAEPLLDEAFEAERRRPVWRAEAHNLQFLGRLRIFQGNPEGAIDALEKSRAVYRRAGPPAWHAFLYAETLRLLVHTYWDSGHRQLAGERANELDDLAARFLGDPVWAFAWRGRAICAREEDGGRRSLELLEKSREVWARLGWKYDFGGTWFETADVQASAGLFDDARRSYGLAAARFRELGALPDLARTERRIEQLSG